MARNTAASSLRKRQMGGHDFGQVDQAGRPVGDHEAAGRGVKLLDAQPGHDAAEGGDEEACQDNREQQAPGDPEAPAPRAALKPAGRTQARGAHAWRRPLTFSTLRWRLHRPILPGVAASRL